MSSTGHDSSTVYDSARRCILSILSFFPQPIKTFGLYVLPSLEPKASSVDSTVYDIIFAGGCFKFNAIGAAVVLTTWIGSGGAAACVTAGRLAEADPSLKILVRFFKRKFGPSVFFYDSKSLRSWKKVHIPAMNQLSHNQGAIFASAIVPQTYLLAMWQNLVLLYVVVHRPLLQDGPLAEDLVLTVRNLSFRLMFSN